MTEENSLLRQLENIQAEALQALQAAQDESSLAAWRTTNLGRSAPVMSIFSRLGEVSKEERPVLGQRANQVKQALETAFETSSKAIKEAALQQSLGSQKLDGKEEQQPGSGADGAFIEHADGELGTRFTELEDGVVHTGCGVWPPASRLADSA